MINRMILALLMVAVMLTAVGYAAESAPLPKVKEVVVFKNGFAYVRCEGEATLSNNQLVVNEIPDASLGAFWGASLTDGVALKSIKAQEVEVPQTETTTRIEDIIKNNTGQKATILTEKQELKGTIVGFQYYQPTEDKLEQTDRDEFYRRYGYYPNQPYIQPQQPRTIEWVTIRTDAGIVAFRVGEIRSIVIEGSNASTNKTITSKTRQLVLAFDGGAGDIKVPVKYTLFFILKGIRWIPDYKVELTEEGKATLKLSATILNEALNIDDASVRLMIGYPRFAFGETVTPLTLRESRRELSDFFRPPAGGRAGYLTNIAAQSVADRMEHSRESSSLPAEAPAAEEGGPVEDLFGYDLKNITLARGNAILIPIAESKHQIEHLYELDTWSFRPLVNRGNIPAELLERVLMPDWDKVWHKLSVKNPGDVPITTAPATVFEKDQPLAQEMIKYAPPGGETVLPITIAVDVPSSLKESETERKHNALQAMDRNWDLITNKGEITITNKKKADVSLVVTRHLLGKVLEASAEGKSEASAAGWEEFIQKLWSGRRESYYWNWWNYYSYYPAVNPISMIKWNVSLKPGESITLGYQYSYYEYR